MQELENIAKISHKYSNRKFQTLIGRTLVGLTIVIPLMLSPLLAAISEPLAFKAVGISLIYALIATIVSSFANNYKTSTIEKFYSSDYWKHQMNKSLIKEIVQNEKKIIKALKEGVSDKDLVSLHTFLLLNESHIIKTLRQIIMQADIKKNELEYKSGNRFEIKNSYEEQKFFDTAPDFNFLNIKKGIEERVSKINASALENLRRAYVEKNYESIDLNLKGLNENTTKNLQFILKTGGYKKLKERDYEDLALVMQKGTLSPLEILKQSSSGGYVFVDWTRVRELVKDNYKYFDESYSSWIGQIEKLIEAQSGEIKNESILFFINRKNEKAPAATTTKTIEIPQLLQYSPNLYKNLWQELINNYKNIAVNENLEEKDILIFNQKLDATVPNLIQADNYLKKLVSATPQSEAIQEQLQNNLVELIKMGEILLANGESNMLKNLSIDKKYLKMSK